MDTSPIEKTSAAEAYGRRRTNRLRNFPSPERGKERLYPLVNPTGRPSFRIAPDDKVFTIGSCFARNVETALVAAGMNVTSRETDLGTIGESRGFTPNYFNKYSIHSVYNDLKWALERDSYPGDDIIYDPPKAGHYADLQLGMPKLEFPIEEIRDFRNRYLDVMARVADADVVILTLGYVETWYDTKLGIYLNSSPPQPLVKAEPDRFEFRVLSHAEVLAALRDLHALLLKHRTKPLKMLITVSPVPLQATFRDMDVLVANTYSKAVQRAAIDEFICDIAGIDYFPSYEYVTLTNPTVAWARDDYRHVNPDLVARIMSQVIMQYVHGSDAEPGYLDPNTFTPKGLLGTTRMLFALGEYDLALGLSKDYPKEFAHDAELMTVLGDVHLHKRDAKAAYDMFKQAYVTDPTLHAPLEKLIKLCDTAGRSDIVEKFLIRHESQFPKRKKFRMQFIKA